MFAQRPEHLRSHPGSNTVPRNTRENYGRPLLLSFSLPLIFSFLSFISFFRLYLRFYLFFSSFIHSCFLASFSSFLSFCLSVKFLSSLLSFPHFLCFFFPFAISVSFCPVFLWSYTLSLSVSLSLSLSACFTVSCIPCSSPPDVPFSKRLHLGRPFKQH